MNVRLITFDLDDTLWPVGPVIRHAEARMRAWLDEHVPAMSQSHDAGEMERLRAEVVAADPDLVHDISEMRRRLLTAALERSGYADARELAEQAFDVFLEARHAVSYYDDVHHTLAHLATHYSLAALTNGNASVTRLEIGPHFEFHLSAEGVGRRKPEPEMFRMALERAGVAPEEAVHIGDHPEDDVRGAARVGMHTVWVNRNEGTWDHPEISPTWQVRSLHELAAIFPGRPEVH